MHLHEGKLHSVRSCGRVPKENTATITQLNVNCYYYKNSKRLHIRYLPGKPSTSTRGTQRWNGFFMLKSFCGRVVIFAFLLYPYHLRSRGSVNAMSSLFDYSRLNRADRLARQLPCSYFTSVETLGERPFGPRVAVCTCPVDIRLVFPII